MIELFFCGIKINYFGKLRVKTCFINKRNGKVIIKLFEKKQIIITQLNIMA